MGLKKHYNENKSLCKVTFKVYKGDAYSANRINLAGDFNNWDVESIPMEKHKSGEFTISVDLEKGKEYQFKYLFDGWVWVNEKEADKFVQNNYQTKNSVIIV